MLALALALCATPALAGKKKPAPTCPPGRFLVEDGKRLLPAGRTPTIDAVVVDGKGVISVVSGCRSVRGKAKRTRLGTQLTAKWPAGACAGVRGKGKLDASIDTACGVMSGTFRAKKIRQQFKATRAEGALLEGTPGDKALPVLVHLTPQPALPADIVHGLLLTRLDVAIAADATVGQVNAALTDVGGGIVAMKAGVPAVTIAVPRRDGADGLRSLADALGAMPGIRLVTLARDAKLDVAAPAPADAQVAFGHLQDARFPAAWNAKRLVQQHCTDKVTVVVADKFHRPADVLYTDFATQVPGVIEFGTGSVAADDLEGHHGYEVLATLGASLDATVPTGANPFPECLELRALQTAGLSQYEIIDAIDDVVSGTDKVVVNSSLGLDGCDGPCTPATMNVPSALDRAAWGAVQRAMLQPLEHRVLVTSSAGNEADKHVGLLYPGTAVAGVGSALNIAAKSDSAMSFVTDTSLWEPTSNCPPEPCFPSLAATPAQQAILNVLLADLGQTSAPPAPNVVIVGSSDHDLNNPSAFSDPGADVYAVGEGIPSFLGVPQSGTSISAPQVTGLAAYLWLLSPDLRARPVADTVAAIEANVRTFPFRLIDAYATVLSLDPAAEPTPAGAKVRLAILDANDDTHFDEADLTLFKQAYRPGGMPIEPSVRDDSRFDLNGDGFTGGSQTAKFDLDPSGSTQFGARMLTQVTTEVGGEERTYDENAVSDADILCFYAYSALYTGAFDARDQLLSDLCGVGNQWTGTVDVGSAPGNSFPACAIIDQSPNAISGTIHQFGGTATLLATLSGSQLLGVSIEGFFVEADCTATGSGTVDGDTITINVTPEAPCNSNMSLTYNFTRGGTCP